MVKTKASQLTLNSTVHLFATIGIALAALLHAPAAVCTPERVDELVRLALQLDPNLARGAKVYGQQCTSCHRKNATGNPQSLVPALAGQREAYLIKQLADFSESERDAKQMHEVVTKASLDEPQVLADLAAYLSRLPVNRRPQRGDGTGAELGGVIFQEQCVECHAPDARGDEDGFVPSLRGQHYAYLIAQMRSLSSSHRKNVDPEFMAFIAGLETPEVSALADYLSRLRGPTRDRSKLRDDGTLRN